MKKQNFKNGFSVLAIIEIIVLTAIFLVLGLMIYNYYFLTQNSEQVLTEETNESQTPADETANWKIYSNYDYGFQMKYPEDWSVNILPEVKNRINFIAPSSQDKIFDFEVRVEPNTEKLSAKDFVQEMLKQNEKEEVNRISYKTSQELIIAGFSAYELNEVFVFNQKQEWIYTAIGDYMYRFAFPMAEENSNLQDPIANNKISHMIFSTFVPITDTAPTKEESCTVSGGKVSTVTCYCSSSADFYNNCVIGGCTCTPDPKYAKQIKNCECPTGKCFDGTKCINQ